VEDCWSIVKVLGLTRIQPLAARQMKRFCGRGKA
jgi:hypothetical protein